MATIDARLLAQLVGLPDDQAVPLILHFETNDGVRAATGPLRRLGFVAQAATPTTVAGWLPPASSSTVGTTSIR